MLPHEQAEKPGVERWPSHSTHLASLPTCRHLLLGLATTQGRLGGTATGGGKPADGLHASHPGEEGSPASVHRRLPPAVGHLVQVGDCMAGLGPRDAAGYRHSLAPYRVSDLLAMEIATKTRPAVDQPGDAGELSPRHSTVLCASSRHLGCGPDRPRRRCWTDSGNPAVVPESLLGASTGASTGVRPRVRPICYYLGPETETGKRCRRGNGVAGKRCRIPFFGVSGQLSWRKRYPIPVPSPVRAMAPFPVPAHQTARVVLACRC